MFTNHPNHPKELLYIIIHVLSKNKYILLYVFHKYQKNTKSKCSFKHNLYEPQFPFILYGSLLVPEPVKQVFLDKCTTGVVKPLKATLYELPAYVT